MLNKRRLSTKAIKSHKQAEQEIAKIKNLMKAYPEKSNDKHFVLYLLSRLRHILKKHDNIRIKTRDAIKELQEYKDSSLFLVEFDLVRVSPEDKPSWLENSEYHASFLQIDRKKIKNRINKPKKKRRKTQKIKTITPNKAEPLNEEISIYLVGGNPNKKDALEKACGRKIEHIQVERHTPNNSELKALTARFNNGTFGIVVSLQKRISHTATRIINAGLKQESKWVHIESPHDNVEIITNGINTAIDQQ